MSDTDKRRARLELIENELSKAKADYEYNQRKRNDILKFLKNTYSINDIPSLRELVKTKKASLDECEAYIDNAFAELEELMKEMKRPCDSHE